MSTNEIHSHQEAVAFLLSACKATIEFLREMNATHLAIDHSESVLTDSEHESVLPLRKASLHIQAITSWPVDTDILHVMGPDIRAASEQLEPSVQKHVYSDSEESVLIAGRRYISKRDQYLEVFSHPTPQVLIRPQHVGGLGRVDVIVPLYKLYELLNGLVCDYGSGLAVLVAALDPSRESEILAVLNRAIGSYTQLSPHVFLQFIEESE